MTTGSSLSSDEHHARAMLMGMRYVEWMNAYAETVRIADKWVDADTMEVLDAEEKYARVMELKP